jgi:hypothetical protein
VYGETCPPLLEKQIDIFWLFFVFFASGPENEE